MMDENCPTLEDRLSREGDPEAPEPSEGRSELEIILRLMQIPPVTKKA